MRTKRTTTEVPMRFISLILATTIAIVSITMSASAGEGYLPSGNGRLTYFNNGQKGYYAPSPRRQYAPTRHYRGQTQEAPRHHYHRDSAAASFGLGVGIGIGIAVGEAIANSQQQYRSADPLSPKEKCFSDGGIWVWNPDVRQEVCALPY